VNDDLRAVLEELDPPARDTLRRVLFHDQADRDAVASHLLRYRDRQGEDWADIIDFLRCIRMRGGGSCGCSARSRRGDSDAAEL